MKLITIFKIVFLAFISVFSTIAIADTRVDHDQAVYQAFLSRVIPTQNAQIIVTRMNEILPEVKSASFPVHDKSLESLTGYAYDAMKNPNFKRAYQRVFAALPIEVRKDNHWASNLNATAVPNEYISTQLGDFVILSACQPHNCPTNIKLIFNPKTNDLWGILHDEHDKKTYLLGNPNDDQLALLLYAVKDDIANY